MPRKRQKNKRQRITTASLQEHQDEQSEEERLGVFAPSSPTSPTSPTLPISPTSILPTKDDEQFQIAPDDSDIDEASQKQARVITVNRNNAKGKRRATKQDMQYRYDQKRMDEANEFVKTFNETTLHQVDNAAISQECKLQLILCVAPLTHIYSLSPFHIIDIKALEALKCDLVAEFRSTILSSMPIMAVAFFTFANSAFGVPNLFSAANRSLKDIVTKYSNLVLSNSNQLSLLTDKEYGAQLKKEVIELLSNDDHTRLLLCADGQFDAYLNQLITSSYWFAMCFMLLISLPDILFHIRHFQGSKAQAEEKGIIIRYCSI